MKNWTGLLFADLSFPKQNKEQSLTGLPAVLDFLLAVGCNVQEEKGVVGWLPINTEFSLKGGIPRVKNENYVLSWFMFVVVVSKKS